MEHCIIGGALLIETVAKNVSNNREAVQIVLKAAEGGAPCLLSKHTLKVDVSRFARGTWLRLQYARQINHVYCRMIFHGGFIRFLA